MAAQDLKTDIRDIENEPVPLTRMQRKVNRIFGTASNAGQNFVQGFMMGSMVGAGMGGVLGSYQAF